MAIVLLYGFCIRHLNNHVNCIQERVLRIVPDDKSSTFKDNSVSVHSRNLQVLATEIYKSMHQLSQTFMKEKSRLIENRYNLWRNTLFASGPFRTQKYSVASLAYLATKIWLLGPRDIKISAMLTLSGPQGFCLSKIFHVLIFCSQ